MLLESSRYNLPIHLCAIPLSLSVFIRILVIRLAIRPSLNPPSSSHLDLCSLVLWRSCLLIFACTSVSSTNCITPSPSPLLPLLIISLLFSFRIGVSRSPRLICFSRAQNIPLQQQIVVSLLFPMTSSVYILSSISFCFFLDDHLILLLVRPHVTIEGPIAIREGTCFFSQFVFFLIFFFSPSLSLLFFFSILNSFFFFISQFAIGRHPMLEQLQNRTVTPVSFISFYIYILYFCIFLCIFIYFFFTIQLNLLRN